MFSPAGPSLRGWATAYTRGPSGRVALLFLLWAGLAAALLIDLPEPWKSEAATRFAEGKKLKLGDYVALGSWFGALANVAISGAALLTLPFWQHWVNANPLPRGISPPGRPPRWFRSALAGVLVLAAILRLPLMNESLLRDEEDTLRRDIWGCYEEQADGTRIFRGVGWRETFWENGGANNPVLFSILSRISLATWRAIHPGEPERFHRPAVRFPSLIAGLAAVMLASVLLWRLGFPRAGLIAALLCALHPWHIRYSVEGRGYALAVAFSLAGFIYLHAALTAGRWRDWAGFAACQFGMLWSFPGSIYLAVAQSAAALLSLSWRSKQTAPCPPSLARFFVCNIMGAMLFIQLMSPCVPQMARYLNKATVFGPMGLPWLEEFAGLMAAGVGMGYYNGKPPTQFGPLLDLSQLPAGWGSALFVCGVIPLLAIAGAIRFAMTDGRTRVLLVAVVMGPVLGFVQNKLSGHYLYPWYLIYTLMPFVCWVAMGADWIAGKQRFRAALICGSLVAAFWMVSHPWASALRRGPGNHDDQLVRGSNIYLVQPEGILVHLYRPPK